MHPTRWLALVMLGAALPIMLTGGGPSGFPGAHAPQGEVPVPANALGLTYTPMPPGFHFQKSEVVQNWIDQNDTKAMMEHAWELWAGLTTQTTQQVKDQRLTVPIFETWVDEFTVFPQPPSAAAAFAPALPKPARLFSLPRQLLHGRAPLTPRALEAAPAGGPPISLRVVAVKYTKEIFEAVQQQGYYKTSTMQALNQSWDQHTPPTPLADRKIRDFPDTSIMLKPTYQLVSGTEGTLLPYWAGPANSSNPSVPAVTTWTKRMLVVPPGVPEIKIQGVPVVKLDRFYSIKLDQQEAQYINSLGQGTVKAGDYALLVAMHVSSREINNWTWQTFWWSITKPSIPEPVRQRVAAPFDNYDVAVGYSFTTGPDSIAGLNVVCFNPYLEADFGNSTFTKPGQLGIESNCMSCHRAATWPPPTQTYYTANGILRPDDPYFNGTTKTDFVWGLPSDVSPPSSSPPSGQP